MARTFAAAWPAAARKTVIGKDDKRKVVEQFADAAELAKFIKHRDWNEYDITARGNRIIEKINGHLMCEVTDEDTMARKDGVIALQIHAGQPMKVQFRNVRLKEFKRGQADESRRHEEDRVPRRRSAATATPSTSTMPAACCWPSASARTCPRPKRSSTRAGRSDPAVPWTTRPAWSCTATAASGHLVMHASRRVRQAGQKGRRPGLHPLCGRGARRARRAT